MAELAHRAHGVGAFLDDIGAADGLNGHAAAVADGDADAVALDQAAAVVGDLEGDLLRLEAAVDLAGEGFQLRPELFLAGHLAEHLGVA